VLKGAAYREQRKKWDRAVKLKRRFGLTVEVYDALLAAQDGVCAICKQPQPGGHRLAVDHDHTTGQLRGLLCSKCNRALGSIEHPGEWGERAAEYLRVHNQWSDVPAVKRAR
jgi:hypothetical protein